MNDIEQRIESCRRISDQQLTQALKAAVSKERESLIDVLVHLGEFDRRELSEQKGYPNIYDYCMQTLKYSRSAAGRRIAVARKIENFPSLLGMIERGDLHLTGAAMLAGHLTSENHRRLLRKATGASQEMIAALIAEISPGLPRRDLIRPISKPAVEIRAAASPVVDPEASASGQDLLFPSAGDAQVEKPPIKSDIFRVSFDAVQETITLIERARELLRHTIPGGDLDAIVRLALRRLITEEDRDLKPVAAGAKASRPTRGHQRRIPESVKRSVWKRDGGCCAFIGEDGRRCRTRAWLEFDHRIPWALGGRSEDAENIRLLCRAHNQWQARRVFGDRVATNGKI